MHVVDFVRGAADRTASVEELLLAASGIWRHGSRKTWTSFCVSGRLNGWVYVDRAEGVALLFIECQYG